LIDAIYTFRVTFLNPIRCIYFMLQTADARTELG
jgi:hypothetical protein